MPGMDRKGPPFGDGNQSGRRMGKCNPENNKDESFNEGQPYGRRRRMRSNFNAENESNENGRGLVRFAKGRGRHWNSGPNRGQMQSGN